jgi:hypothetical protein
MLAVRSMRVPGEHQMRLLSEEIEALPVLGSSAYGLGVVVRCALRPRRRDKVPMR